MRVFYFNITYRCNSNCMFCAADHPIYNEQTEMTLEEIAKILRDNHVGSGDRVIVNGGEPTIHRSFWEILDTIDRLGAKIDLFTNGQKLADEQFAKRLTAYRDIYIRVPLFGATAQVHDYLTGCRGGFDRVVKGLDHVYRYLGKGSQLDIKLLMSRVSVEENEKIYDLVKTRWPGPHVILSLNPLLISKCVIEHKDLFIEEYPSILTRSEPMIRQVYADGRELSMSLIPFCAFPNDDLLSLCHGNTILEHSYYADPNSTRIVDEFAGREQCRQCKYAKKCNGYPDSYVRYFGDRVMVTR